MTDSEVEFRKLTEAIHEHATDDFAGIGLILYEDMSQLSCFSMYDINAGLPLCPWGKILAALQAISIKQHPAHDGFHAISMSGELTHVSLYLAPESSQYREDDENYGSRFYTAKFTAETPGIIATAIISNSYGIRFF
jgi:hypothetical protein